MIAFIGWTMPGHPDRAQLALGHTSIAVAAVALARTGEITDCITSLWDECDIDGSRIRVYPLASDGAPTLSSRAGLAVIANQATGRLGFFACNAWHGGADCEWGSIGQLAPNFALGDVEGVEAMLYLAYPPRPTLRAVGS